MAERQETCFNTGFSFCQAGCFCQTCGGRLAFGNSPTISLRGSTIVLRNTQIYAQGHPFAWKALYFMEGNLSQKLNYVEILKLEETLKLPAEQRKQRPSNNGQ